MTSRAKIKERLGDGWLPTAFHVVRLTRGQHDYAADIELITGNLVPVDDEQYAVNRMHYYNPYNNSPFSDILTFDNVAMDNFGVLGVRTNVGVFDQPTVAVPMMHPLGFAFNIDIENFEYLLDNFVIHKGIICNLVCGELVPAKLMMFYHKATHRVGLYPEGHDLLEKYRMNMIPQSEEHKAMEAEVRAKTKKKQADLQIGDKIKKERREVTYLGRWNVANTPLTDPSGDVSFKYFHVFRHEEVRNNKELISYDFRSSIGKIELLGRREEITTEQALDELKTFVSKQTHFSDKSYVLHYMTDYLPLGVFASKPKKWKAEYYTLDFDAIITSPNNRNFRNQFGGYLHLATTNHREQASNIFAKHNSKGTIHRVEYPSRNMYAQKKVDLCVEGKMVTFIEPVYWFEGHQDEITLRGLVQSYLDTITPSKDIPLLLESLYGAPIPDKKDMWEWQWGNQREYTLVQLVIKEV